MNYICDNFVDLLFKLAVGNYTTTLTFDRLDKDILMESFMHLHDDFGLIHFGKLRFVRTLDNEKYNLVRFDISVNVLLKSQRTILQITASHHTIDGMLLNNVLRKWAVRYSQIEMNKRVRTTLPRRTSPHSVHTKDLYNQTVGCNMMINPVCFDSFKIKYGHSDYVISTAIWSHFMHYNNQKNRFFGHINGFRTENNKELGNFVGLDVVEIGSTILETCNALRSKFQSNNRIHKIDSLDCLNIKLMQVSSIFDSWTFYKHLSFSDNALQGVSASLNVHLPIHVNVVLTVHGNYGLSGGGIVDEMSNATFESWLSNVAIT
jgi:hypothetical protein